METVNSCRNQSVFDPAAHDVERVLEIFLIDSLGVGEQNLLNLRAGGVRLLS